jgi:hypothetical protein
MCLRLCEFGLGSQRSLELDLQKSFNWCNVDDELDRESDPVKNWLTRCLACSDVVLVVATAIVDIHLSARDGHHSIMGP